MHTAPTDTITYKHKLYTHKAGRAGEERTGEERKRKEIREGSYSHEFERTMESSDKTTPQLSYISKEKDLDREWEMTIRGKAVANSCSMPGDAVYVKSCAMFLATWQSISCKPACIGPRND